MCSWRGKAISATNWPCPLSSGASSNRGTERPRTWAELLIALPPGSRRVHGLTLTKGVVQLWSPLRAEAAAECKQDDVLPRRVVCNPMPAPMIATVSAPSPFTVLPLVGRHVTESDQHDHAGRTCEGDALIPGTKFRGSAGGSGRPCVRRVLAVRYRGFQSGNP